MKEFPFRLRGFNPLRRSSLTAHFQWPVSSRTMASAAVSVPLSPGAAAAASAAPSAAVSVSTDKPAARPGVCGLIRRYGLIFVVGFFALWVVTFVIVLSAVRAGVDTVALARPSPLPLTPTIAAAAHSAALWWWCAVCGCACAAVCAVQLEWMGLHRLLGWSDVKSHLNAQWGEWGVAYLVTGFTEPLRIALVLWVTPALDRRVRAAFPRFSARFLPTPPQEAGADPSEQSVKAN
jgi:hypothetical protein